MPSDRRPDRYLLSVGVLALAAQLAPRVAAAAPSPSYVELASQYAQGQRAEAVAKLGTWPEARLRSELAALKAWVEEAARCGGCETARGLERFPLQAAVMLHVDREAFERRSALPNEESAPECRFGPHARAAEWILELLPSRPGGAEFARRVYRAMALEGFGRGCAGDAEHWSKAGLKRFPRDTDLLLFRARLLELFAAQSASSWRGRDLLASTQRQRGAARDARYQELRDLDEARNACEQALAADPNLDEARLRLGRVEWRLGHREAARARLGEVLERSKTPSLLYLASLFLGRVDEDAGHMEAAERNYRSAVERAPASQTAAVALSFVLQLEGNAAAAREALERALAGSEHRERLDPFWDYLWPSPDEVEELLARLRQEASS